MSRTRKQSAIDRKNKVFKMKLVLVLMIAGIISVCIILKSKAMAIDFSKRNATYYKSIEVKAGDSLWSIAEEYGNKDVESIQAYINELKSINSLRSDDIHENQYLMVTYKQ